VQRPATGRTWTVVLTPAFNHAAPSPGASPKLLNGDIAYAQLSGFFPGAADLALQLISNLTTGTKLHGLILDLCDDGSLLGLPAKRELGPDHELINGIGVAPDYYIPLTAQYLSTGHDPDIAKALTLLGG
jgi:carboxyl-terminal processing protease